MLEIAAEQGIEAVERDIWPMELHCADGAFVCGSGAGIVPIGSFDGRPVTQPEHPLIVRIQDAYRRADALRAIPDGAVRPWTNVRESGALNVALHCGARRVLDAEPALTGGFTPAHRGGSGPPLVCLHGFTGSWRIWDLVLPRLERHYDVLAPTLAGHAGGPPLPAERSDTMLAEAVERAMDAAGFERARIVGNSLGGHVALQLAERGRAESVVALAPGGGWPVGHGSIDDTMDFFRQLLPLLPELVGRAAFIASRPEGRRRVLQDIAENWEHVPPETVIEILRAAAACTAAPQMIEFASRKSWELDPERIECPVRIVWGTADKLLPWPIAASRYRTEWLPHADWVVLDGVGHCPQIDIPLETAELILGFN